jgi:DNA-directed RNA polymerase I, II, and III subunit RPABC1
MSQSSQVISNLFRSRKILLELMKERGYNISSQENFTENEIRVMAQQKQLDFELENPNKDKKVFIKYLISTKIRNTSLKNYLTEFLEENPDIDPVSTDFIIILKDKPNESLLKVVDDFYSEKQIYINLFYIKSLLFNILKHEYVPDHKIISEEIFRDMKNIYNLNSRYQLPIIHRHDAVSNVLGIRPGEVVKITRPSKTAGQYVSYRCCK